MPNRLSRLALCVFVFLSACAPYFGVVGLPEIDGRRLVHLVDGSTVRAVDPETGAVRFERSRAVLTPDHAHVVSATPVEDGTRIDSVRGDTGGSVASHTVPGTLDLIVASPGGLRVALAEPAGTEVQGTAPGRERTEVVVADLERRAHRAYHLPGNFMPEVFSFTGDRLFLVEYLPALAPDRYRVRQLDLASGAVTAVGARDKIVTVEEEMRGRSRTHQMAPDRTRLYTLYLREDDHLHLRDYPETGGSGRPNPEVKAFVHVLSLTEGWAYCLDLPMPFGLGPGEAHALALSPDGRYLYVVDASSGRSMAVADTRSLQLVTIRPKAAPFVYPPGARTALRAARDGTLYLGVGAEVHALDSEFRSRHRLALAEPMIAFELSPDGSRLVVLSSSRLTVVATKTGGVVAEYPLSPEALSAAPIHEHSTLWNHGRPPRADLEGQPYGQ